MGRAVAFAPSCGNRPGADVRGRGGEEPDTEKRARALESAIAEHIALKAGEVSPATLNGYRSSLRKIQAAAPRFAQADVRDVSTADIRKYETMRLRKGVSPNSVRKEHSLICMALDPFVERGELEANPARAVNPPKKALRAAEPPRDAERIVALVSMMQGRTGLAANLAIDAKATACQVGALVWADFDERLTEGVLRRRVSPEHGIVTAYRNPRAFPVSETTRKKLMVTRARARAFDDAAPGAKLFNIAPIAILREFNNAARIFGLDCTFSELQNVDRGDSCTM